MGFEFSAMVHKTLVTRNSAETGYLLADVAANMPPDTGANNVDVFEVRALLDVESTEDGDEFQGHHPGALFDRVVPVQSRVSPVNHNHICFFLHRKSAK